MTFKTAKAVRNGVSQKPFPFPPLPPRVRLAGVGVGGFPLVMKFSASPLGLRVQDALRGGGVPQWQDLLCKKHRQAMMPDSSGDQMTLA